MGTAILSGRIPRNLAFIYISHAVGALLINSSPAGSWMAKTLLDISNWVWFPFGIPRKLAVLAIAKRLVSSLLAGTEVFCLRSRSGVSQGSERGSLMISIAERLQNRTDGQRELIRVSCICNNISR
jgi:hypothetical protein